MRLPCDAGHMDVKLIAVATILLTACSSSEERKHDALMDQIEKQVRLPDGARPLTEYARYYTSDRDGRVFAVFTTFREPKFDTFNLEPGKRRWVSNPVQMPAISEAVVV